jgi:hypothetical protein
VGHADAEGENPSPKIRVTVVVANRFAFDTETVTGRQIKEKANLPSIGFSAPAGSLGVCEAPCSGDRR